MATLTDTGEASKLVHRRKRPKVDTQFFFLFFSDAFERRVRLSAESKILASYFGRFRLYRLIIRLIRKIVIFENTVIVKSSSKVFEHSFFKNGFLEF